MKTHFILYVATASMPGSYGYPYDYCAVLEVPSDVERPPAINHESVIRVVECWAPYPRRGTTMRSARMRPLAQATDLVQLLNDRPELPELPPEPPRNLSAVAARTCPVSGLVSHG